MNTMIAPVLALVSWTLVMWAWMYAQRLPAMTKAGIKPQDARFPGALDVLPDHARQAAHNYNHLMEQPTIFYAAALAIFVAGHGDGTAVALAWTYVGLRIVHSLVQASVNIVMARFLAFGLSTLVLVALVAREWVKLAG